MLVITLGRKKKINIVAKKNNWNNRHLIEALNKHCEPKQTKAEVTYRVLTQN